MKDFTYENYNEFCDDKEFTDNISSYNQNNIIYGMIVFKDIILSIFVESAGERYYTPGSKYSRYCYGKALSEEKIKEYGFDRVEIGKDLFVLIKYNDKLTEKSFLKTLGIQSYESQGTIYAISLFINDGCYFNFNSRNDGGFGTMINYGSKSIEYPFSNITNEIILKKYEKDVKTAQKKKENIEKKLSNIPVFCIFDTCKTSFKYIGYKNEKNEIKKFSNYGVGEQKLNLIKNIARMLADDKNTLQIQYGSDIYIFKRDILFTSTEFYKGGDIRYLKISKTLPEIPLDEKSLKKIEEFGCEYFEDPSEYYSWALLAELAE